MRPTLNQHRPLQPRSIRAGGDLRGARDTAAAAAAAREAGANRAAALLLSQQQADQQQAPDNAEAGDNEGQGCILLRPRRGGSGLLRASLTGTGASSSPGGSLSMRALGSGSLGRRSSEEGVG